jgi:hypothetical protein
MSAPGRRTISISSLPTSVRSRRNIVTMVMPRPAGLVPSGPGSFASSGASTGASGALRPAQRPLRSRLDAGRRASRRRRRTTPEPRRHDDLAAAFGDRIHGVRRRRAGVVDDEREMAGALLPDVPDERQLLEAEAVERVGRLDLDDVAAAASRRSSGRRVECDQLGPRR